MDVQAKSLGTHHTHNYPQLTHNVPTISKYLRFSSKSALIIKVCHTIAVGVQAFFTPLFPETFHPLPLPLMFYFIPINKEGVTQQFKWSLSVLEAARLFPVVTFST